MGILAREDGTWYEGEWLNGERHGKGCEHFSKDDQYTGDWKNDLYDGKGVLEIPGKRFCGEWRRGIRHKKGCLTTGWSGEQSFQIEYDVHGNEVSRLTQQEAEIDSLRLQLAEAENRLNTITDDESVQLANNQTRQLHSTQNESARENVLCKVCFVNPITRVLRPCKHACLCEICEMRIKEQTPSRTGARIKCPVCRQVCRSSDEIIIG